MSDEKAVKEFLEEKPQPTGSFWRDVGGWLLIAAKAYARYYIKNEIGSKKW